MLGLSDLLKINIMILTLLKELRESYPSMGDIFLNGSCLNLYFILLSHYPSAECYFDMNHVITKIDDKFYDITGEVTDVEGYELIHNIYAYKYKTIESLRESEMYKSK